MFSLFTFLPRQSKKIKIIQTDRRQSALTCTKLYPIP